MQIPCGRGKTQRGFELRMVICLCGIRERGTRGELLCPTCGLPIETDSSICCDRCDIWYHMKCEQINLEIYALYDSSELGVYMSGLHTRSTV